MAVDNAQYESGQRLAIDRDIWRRAEDTADRILGSRIPPLQICWLPEEVIKQRAAQPLEEPGPERIYNFPLIDHGGTQPQGELRPVITTATTMNTIFDRSK
jgi:hypothetical protein